MSDPVNHPPHYCQGGVECITVLEQLGIARDYCRGNAIKYLWRMADKGKALEDAKKAQWYVNRLVGYLESEAHVSATELDTSVDSITGGLPGGGQGERLLQEVPAAGSVACGCDGIQADKWWNLDTLEIQCGGGP